MQKYSLSLIAVAVTLVLAAFTKERPAPKKLPVNFVWFDVNPNAPSQSILTDADVTFNSSLSGAPATNPSGCSMISTYNCTVGFDQNQVTGTHLKPGNQTIQTSYYLRATQ